MRAKDVLRLFLIPFTIVFDFFLLGEKDCNVDLLLFNYCFSGVEETKNSG